MCNAHTPWVNATTETVTFGDVRVGDAVYLPGPVGGLAPVRVRAAERHLGGRVALFVADVLEVDNLVASRAGLFAVGDSVKRVVIS